MFSQAMAANDPAQILLSRCAFRLTFVLLEIHSVEAGMNLWHESIGVVCERLNLLFVA